MRPSPLQLNDYWVDNLTFSTNYDHDPDEPVVRVISAEDLLVEVQESVNPENSLQRSCNISIALNESAAANFPWRFNVSLVGYFQIAEDWPGNKDSLFSANAPAVLYSAAREALAAVSGRGPYREVLLPSVTFVILPPPPEKQIPAAAKVPPEGETKVASKGGRKAARKQGKD